MKNKEITIYELMGLIEDNKAPEKIKIYDDEFVLIANHYFLNGILERENDLFYKISGGYATLNDTVEILPEENDEWEDIEEINIKNEGNGDFIINEYGTKCGLTKHSKIIAEKVNQLIKNQKYLKSKLESKDE